MSSSSHLACNGNRTETRARRACVSLQQYAYHLYRMFRKSYHDLFWRNVYASLYPSATWRGTSHAEICSAIKNLCAKKQSLKSIRGVFLRYWYDNNSTLFRRAKTRINTSCSVCQRITQWRRSFFACTSDGTFLYPYNNRMCYFDTLIEQF